MMAAWIMATAIGVIVLLLQFHVKQAVAWGAAGHLITCLIAEPLLYEPAENAIAKLLPESANGNLASLCNWPDEVRWMSKYKWTRELHWVNTPDQDCKYDYNRDCHDSLGRKDVCVAGAINKFTQQLSDYTKNHTTKNQNTTEALLFLAHFVGDIHQPLHAGFRSDGGGNNVSVHWYRRKTNLHNVWDTEFVEKALKEKFNSDPTVMADSILNNITDQWASEVDSWGLCRNNKLACPDTYATEGINLACRWAYKGATPGTTLGDSYYISRFPIVERSLAKGGVRLAAILNGIFDPDAPQRSPVLLTPKGRHMNTP
ncbi:hypothetical protein M758_4G149600 [Ceratodon purpureus]|uniref:Aspergillus nuclease S1 n=1 Tax=Ceratodon purpureus TaxID=3225 RepID=A0A8T0IAZ9_CERPU|nr:hypothetical protein KC19_4G148000 [Ceratodon purpureus]KAG0619580.1 hypothetical protein M758_4G149600 [Ceratodon purpureus]